MCDCWVLVDWWCWECLQWTLGVLLMWVWTVTEAVWISKVLDGVDGPGLLVCGMLVSPLHTGDVVATAGRV